LETLLSHLPILDVCSRYIPAHNPSLLVEERVITKEIPTILAVLSEKPPFSLKRNPFQESVLTYFSEWLIVIRMKDAIARTFCPQLFVVLNPDGRTVYVNRVALEYTGLSILWL
jgi:PAS domain-containing protein